MGDVEYADSRYRETPGLLSLDYDVIDQFAERFRSGRWKARNAAAMRHPLCLDALYSLAPQVSHVYPW